MILLEVLVAKNTMVQPWFDNHGFELITFLVCVAKKTTIKTTMVRWLNYASTVVEPWLTWTSVWYDYIDNVVASWVFAPDPTTVEPGFFTMMEPWFDHLDEPRSYHGSITMVD